MELQFTLQKQKNKYIYKGTINIPILKKVKNTNSTNNNKNLNLILCIILKVLKKRLITKSPYLLKIYFSSL